MNPHYIDSHAHLAAPDYKDDISEVVERAQAAGVVHIVTIGAGYGKQSAEDAIKLADKFDCLSLALGLHPCDSIEKIDVGWIRDLAKHAKVRALGETGLDYHWKQTDPEIQKHNFLVHIELAKERKLPLVIHSRDAAEDCLQILIESGASEVGGVFHCYSEGAAFAKRLAEINFKVSFPGVLTFKKADAMRQAAKDIPLDQIMIETDCPYLAPQRVRGKRCEPAYVVDVAVTLAAVKEISLEQVAKVTTENAMRIFNISPDKSF